LDGTELHSELTSCESPIQWMTSEGVFARAFPVESTSRVLAPHFSVNGDLVEITNTFNLDGKGSPFAEAGCLVGRDVATARLAPRYDGPFTALGDVLVEEEAVPEEFFIRSEEHTSELQ